MMQNIQLTPELEEKILAGIRAGGFPHVAAGAFGVPDKLFRKWLRRGTKRKDERYCAFVRNVARAQATARLNAEIQTHGKDPRLWLRSGPGRETAAAVGWTTFVRPRARKARRSGRLLSPAFLRFLADLRNVLAPFPEALDAVTKNLTAAG